MGLRASKLKSGADQGAAKVSSDSDAHAVRHSASTRGLAYTSHFTLTEVSELRTMFQKLAAESSEDPSRITKTQLESIVSKSNDLPFDRVFELMDLDGCGSLDFREFILALSSLTRGTAAEKFKMAFEVFDIDDTCSISRSEMCSVLGSMHHASSTLSGNSEKSIDEFVDAIFKHADVTGDGLLSYPEFLKAALKCPGIINFDTTEPFAGPGGVAPPPSLADDATITKGIPILGAIVGKPSTEALALLDRAFPGLPIITDGHVEAGVKCISLSLSADGIVTEVDDRRFK